MCFPRMAYIICTLYTAALPFHLIFYFTISFSQTHTHTPHAADTHTLVHSLIELCAGAALRDVPFDFHSSPMNMHLYEDASCRSRDRCIVDCFLGVSRSLSTQSFLLLFAAYVKTHMYVFCLFFPFYLYHLRSQKY